MEALTNSELITIVNGIHHNTDLGLEAKKELLRRIRAVIPEDRIKIGRRVDSIFDIAAIEAEHKKVLEMVCKTKEIIGAHWSDLDMMSFAVDYRQTSGASTVIDFFNQWKAKRNANH